MLTSGELRYGLVYPVHSKYDGRDSILTPVAQLLESTLAVRRAGNAPAVAYRDGSSERIGTEGDELPLAQEDPGAARGRTR